MIQLPDNRKCYNLQEQVAQNLNNITYLAQVYAEIDALPAEWRSYKAEFDAEKLIFEGWTTTFEGWDTTLATYLANMSSAAVGALAGQDVSVKTIEQTNANWSADMSFSPGTLPSDVSYTAGFSKAIKINGEIHFIFHCKLTNSGGSSQTVFYLGAANILLPQAISEKIYDMEGNTVHEHVDSNVLITAGKATVCSSLSAISSAFGEINFGLFHSNNLIDRLSFQVALSTGLAIPAGETRYISARVCLTLVG